MASIYPKFPTKWETAKKTFNRKMRELNDDGSKAIQDFIVAAARYEKAAKVNPASGNYIIAANMHNAAPTASTWLLASTRPLNNQRGYGPTTQRRKIWHTTQRMNMSIMTTHQFAPASWPMLPTQPRKLAGV